MDGTISGLKYNAKSTSLNILYIIIYTILTTKYKPI